MIPLFFLFFSAVSPLNPSFFCPDRCQCYDDVEEKSSSVHLICKWEQLNSTNLQSLGRPELVRTLTIRCPHYTVLPSYPAAGLFHGLRNLDRLEIDRCVLKNLPAALFAGLHQLYSLIIRHAQLDDIPKELFTHTPSLMTLDLSGNRLRIEPYALRSLRNLIHLDLSNNTINFLANTLVSLTKLSVLTMDHNKLSNIDFRRLPESLTDLSLRHNAINTIHYVPNSARHLHRLDLSGNLLGFLSASGSVNSLPASLRSADLSNNLISYIQEGTVDHMHHLVVLNLRNNSLSELKESAVSSSKTKLRLFISHNPFACHCSMRWLIHPSSKNSPNVLDLKDVTCSHLTIPDHTLQIHVADSKNQLLCKYTKICPTSCTCCDDASCECRTLCPTGCQCYRSVRMDVERTSSNTIICDNVRLDRLEPLPSSITELRLNDVNWKEWNTDNFNKSRLRSLSITNTEVTENEANTLASLPSLVEADLSSNRISVLPVKLSHLTRLRLDRNPLEELNSADVALLNAVKRISLGGNMTKFICDCDTPSVLQRWLREKHNREKVEDLDTVLCALDSFGKVPVVSTLPGNESICVDETPETTQWVKFVENTSKHLGNTSLPTLPTSEELTSRPSDIRSDGATPEVKTSTTTEPTTTTRKRTPIRRTTTRRPPPPTTTWHRRKYYTEEPEEHMFVNALIVILVICVVVLAIAIGTTLYYRFEQAEDESMDKDMPEQMPLHR